MSTKFPRRFFNEATNRVPGGIAMRQQGPIASYIAGPATGAAAVRRC